MQSPDERTRAVARARGFALAAVVCGDRGAARAEPGIDPRHREAWLSQSRYLLARDRRARATVLEAWTRAPRLSVDVAGHPRALALLASHASPALGQRWLSASAPPRPGFVADPALVHLLLRRAAHMQERRDGHPAPLDVRVNAASDPTGRAQPDGDGDPWDA